MNTINWYKNTICLNVLAKDLQNAKEVYKAAEGHVLVGILSKNYSQYQNAIYDMKAWALNLDNNISIGLGAGDPSQSYKVAELTKLIKPNHANQVFTGVGLTNSRFGQQDTFINCLVSPSGTVGLVKINTGALSSKEKDAIIPIDTAIAMIKDMGANSVKFFDMKGLTYIDEFKVVAEACAKHNFAIEPTGGITLDNFKTIVTIAVNAGVKKIIPHVYSSIIDKKTGNTKIEDVDKLMSLIKEII